MALHCVNTQSKEFKSLLETTGLNPIKLAAKVADWQQLNDTTNFPTSNQIVAKESQNINQVLNYVNKNFGFNKQGFINKDSGNALGEIRQILRRNGLIDLGYNVSISDIGSIYLTKDGKKYNHNIKFSEGVDRTYKDTQEHIEGNSPIANKAKQILGLEANQTTPTTQQITPKITLLDSNYPYTKKTAVDNPNTNYVFTENAEAYTASQGLVSDRNEEFPYYPNKPKLNVTPVNNQAGIRTDGSGKVNPNAVGIIVKKYQQNAKGRFVAQEGTFKDNANDFEMFKSLNEHAFNRLQFDNKPIVFPKQFALGKAALPKRFAEWLQTQFKDRFGVISELKPNNTSDYSGWGLQVNQNIQIDQTQLSLFDSYQLSEADQTKLYDLIDSYITETSNPTPEGLVEHYKNQKLADSKRVSEDFVYQLNNPHSKFQYRTVSHVNKLLSFIAFNSMEELKGMTVGDIRKNNTIKNNLVEKLEETVEYRYEQGAINQEQYDFITKQILPELKVENSQLWDSFVNHFGALYNIHITDMGNVLNELGFEEIPIWWDDRQQLKVDLRNSIQAKVRFALSSITNGINELTGLPEVVDLHSFLNRLINANRFNTTNDHYLDTLQSLAKDYEGINRFIATFAHRDSVTNKWVVTDENLFNAYKSALNYDLAQVYAMAVSTANKFNVVDMLISNRYSFVENLDYDKWYSNIKTKASKKQLGFLRTIADGILLENSLKNYKSISYNHLIGETIDSTEISYKAFEKIANILTNIGIPISAESINDIYNSSKYAELGDKRNLQFRKDFIEPVTMLFKELAQVAYDKRTNFVTNEKGNIHKIAKFYATHSNTLTQLDYFNVNSDNVYTPIYQSYLGKLFKGLDSIATVERHFKKFTLDAKFQYDNFLWNEDGTGIFNYDEAHYIEHNQKIIDESNPVNLAFTSALQPKFFNGIKQLNDQIGLEYSKVISNTWDTTSLLSAVKRNKNNNQLEINGDFYIPSSDSGRIAALPFKFQTYEIIEEMVDGKKEKRYDRVIKYNKDTDTWSVKEGSKIHTQLKNTILQELKEMQILAQRIYIPSSLTGELTPKQEFKTADGLAKLKSPKHWDGNSLINPKTKTPTGKAFTFNNLTYTVTENGVTKTVTLNDRLENVNYLTVELNSDIIQVIINEFIADAVNANIKETLNYYKDSIPILMRYARYGIEGKKMKASNLSSEQIAENTIFRNIDEVRRTIAEYYVSNYLAQVFVGNFINGNPNEYKNVKDLNKRIGQSIKNGMSNNSNRTYTNVVIKDVYTNSPFHKQLKKLAPNQAKHYDSKEGATNSTDAFTIIRDKEGLARATDFGRHDSYEQLYKDFENPNTPDVAPDTYDRLLESQKYFDYSRDIDNSLGHSEIISKQVKNSTMVLTPKSVAGTVLADVLQWMDDAGIDQLTFETARKVGGNQAIQIFDKNGNFIKPDIINPKEDIRVETKNVSDLVVQQDVVPHTIDSTNKIAVQLEKHILTNLDYNNPIYNIPGVKNPVNGDTLREHYHNIINANIRESAVNLLDEFGAIKDNEIQMELNEDGTTRIKIDEKKVIKYLQSYVQKNETNDTLLKAINDVIEGQSNIPLYSSLTAQKFSEILYALFTNNVINQRIPGIHGAIVPDLGLNPSTKFISDNKIDWNKYHNESAIQWADDFKAKIEADGNVKLGITQIGDINYVDVVVSRFNKHLFEDGIPVDINRLSHEAREMFGIRIPTEGKQSMFVFRAVGFFNHGASQIIMPDAMVTKTGQDFDIDTAYIYVKTLEQDANGIFNPVKYMDSTTNLKDRHKAYVNKSKAAYNIRLKYTNELQRAYSKITNSKAQLDARLDKKQKAANQEYKNAIDAIASIKEARKEVLELINENAATEWSRSDNANIAIGQLHDIIKEMDEEIVYISEVLNMTLEEVATIKSRRSDRLNELWTNVNTIKAKIDSEILNSYPIDKFKELSIENQNTRDARNNRLIDIYNSVASNKHHQNEYWKPNTMDNLSSVSEWINGLYGFNIDGFNIHNVKDAAILRNLNMSTRVLKGNSVAWDGIMSVLGYVGAQTYPLHFRVKKGDNFTADNVSKFKHLFDVSETSDGYIISTSHIGNNKAKTWVDVNGLHITDQAAEVTTNILDAVGTPMGININEYMLPVFRLLSSTALAHKFKGNPNRFLLPYLFTHQPILLDYSTNFGVGKSYNLSYNKHNAATQTYVKTRTKVIVNLLPTLAERLDGGDTHPLYKYILERKDNDYIRIPRDYQEEFETIYNDVKEQYIPETDFKLLIPDVSELEANIHTYNRLQTDEASFSTSDKLEYYFKQLEILSLFQEVDNIGSSVVSAISTFNTDKLSTGFANNRKLFENVENLMLDKTKLKRHGIANDRAENGWFGIEDVNNLLDSMDKVRDLKEKARIYNTFAEYWNIDTSNYTPLRVETESLVEHIYPVLFKDVSPDAGNYTTLQNYMYYGHLMSDYAFKQFFPHEIGEWYDIRSKILQKHNLDRDDFTVKQFNSYVNTAVTIQDDFFQSSNNSVVKDIAISKGIENISLVEKSILFGKPIEDLSEANINIDNPTDNDLLAFNALPTVSKIRLLLDSTVVDNIRSNPIYNNDHILDHIVVEDDFETVNKRGYTTFRLVDSGDVNYMRESLTHMLYGYQTNSILGEMLSVTAEEMIKNHAYLHGITFGRNISKYIDADMLYIGDKSLNPNRHMLYKYADNLRRVEHQDIIPNFTEAYYKAKWNNSNLVPVMSPTVDNNGNIIDALPLYKTLNEVVGNIVEEVDYSVNYGTHIIIEPIAKFTDNGAPYHEYMVKNIDGNSVLYKAYYNDNLVNAEGDGFVSYYPIVKTLPHEFIDTGIDNYRKLRIGSEEVSDVYIRPEAEYQAAIELYLSDTEAFTLLGDPSVKITKEGGIVTTKQVDDGSVIVETKNVVPKFRNQIYTNKLSHFPISSEQSKGIKVGDKVRIKNGTELVAVTVERKLPKPIVDVTEGVIERAKVIGIKPTELMGIDVADKLIVASTIGKDGVFNTEEGMQHGRITGIFAAAKNIDTKSNVLGEDGKITYLHSDPTSPSDNFAESELSKLDKDTLVVVNEATSDRILKYLDDNGFKFRILNQEGQSNPAIQHVRNLFQISKENLNNPIIKFKPYVLKESKSLDNETIYSYEGSNIEMVNKLANRSDISIYLGDANNIFAKQISNNERGIVLDLNTDNKTLSNILTNLIKKIKSVEEILILGDEVTNLTQEQLNSKVNNLLRDLSIKNKGNKFITNTINIPGVANAVRANMANIPTQVYSNVKSKNKFNINTAKYSEGLELEGDRLNINHDSFNDMNYMQGQVDAIINTLSSIVKYKKEYANTGLAYKDTLTEVTKEIYEFGDINKITDMDIDAFDIALRLNTTIVDDFVRHLKQINERLQVEVDKGTFQNLSQLDYKQGLQLQKDVRQARHLSHIIYHLNELNEVDASRGDETKIEKLNERINYLRKVRKEAGKLITDAVGFQKQLLHGKFIQFSNNPQFMNELNTKLDQYNKEGVLVGDEHVKVNISAEQFFNQYQKLLVENEAMNWGMLNMDSAFDTGILLVDSVMKTYFEGLAYRSKMIMERSKKAHNLLKDYFGKGFDLGLRTDDASITNKFYNKFINGDYGTFHSKYQYDKFWESKQKAIEERNHAYNEITVLKSRLSTLKVKLDNGTLTQEQYNTQRQEITDKIKANREIVKNRINDWIKENQITDETTKLTKEEIEKAEYYRENHADGHTFEKYLRNNNIDYNSNTGEYIKVIPKDNYLSVKYKELDAKDIKFMEEFKALLKEIIEDTHGEVILNENFFPIALRKGLKEGLKQTFGWKEIVDKDIEVGIMNEWKYVLDKPMIYQKNRRFTISYDSQGVTESKAEYEKRIVESANKRYRGGNKFNSIADIEAYNEKVKKYNKEYNEVRRDYNPISILKSFIDKSADYKNVRDFENILMLLMNEIQNGDYKEHRKVGWAKRVDSIISRIKGEKEYKTLSKTDTTASIRLKKFLNPLYSVGNVHSNIDRAFSVARSATSLVFMGGNILGAIKNATKGYHDMLMESYANQYIGSKHLNSAINRYRKMIPQFLADIHKEYSDNLDVAILKHPTFQEMLELRDNDGQLISMKENKEKALAILNNAAFFGMNSTEHFMQYTMMFAMMESHRIVQGKVISFEQFARDNREKILLDMLSPEQKENYLEYKRKVDKAKVKFSDNYDTVRNWVEVHENMEMSQRKEFGDKVKQLNKIIEENFQKFENVYSQFELKDGTAVTKEGSALTDTEIALFMAKAQKVNQKLHGVYNRVDRMALRNSTVGDLALQFRSWVKPNWDRYMGKRWGRSVYSEALGTYQKGAYVSMYDFLTTPIRANKTYTGEERTQLEALSSIVGDYFSFFKNASVYYHTLPLHEQANIWRAATNFLGILITSASLALLGKLVSRGEDEDKVDSYALALFVYELNMIHSEITQFIPVAGWHGFYRRSKLHPLAAEKVLHDMAKLAQNTLAYPFQDDEQRYHQRGIYKDRLRIEVQASKLTPIYRQRDKFENLQSYVAWYKLYNPFDWMFGFGSK